MHRIKSILYVKVSIPTHFFYVSGNVCNSVSERMHDKYVVIAGVTTVHASRIHYS